MSQTKCAHCPFAAEAGECPGDRNARHCQLINPASPAYRPDWAGKMRASFGPGWLQKAASFIGAVAGHIAKGAPTVSPEVKEARLAICRTNDCGHYSAAHTGPACLACGCGQRGLEWKASWADSSCPLDPPRWGPVEAEE